MFKHKGAFHFTLFILNFPSVLLQTLFRFVHYLYTIQKSNAIKHFTTMKKIIIFSTLMALLISLNTLSFANDRPHGHKQYVKHSKHHSAHKIHKPHGLIDATYR